MIICSKNRFFIGVCVGLMFGLGTAGAENLKKLKIQVTTAVPGNLFYPMDKIVCRVSVTPPPKPAELTVTGNFFDAWNRPVTKMDPIILNQAGGYSHVLKLPAKLGYYLLKLEVSDGKNTKSFETRYAVIPNNFVKGKDPASPFGVNTHFNQGWSPKFGKIIKRTGIAWIRDGESGLNDRACPVAEANDLCYMACFTIWRGRLAKRFEKTLSENPGAPRKWDFSEIVEWHRKYAEKYGDKIDAYDLMNEPHCSWVRVLGGGWWGGRWVNTFADYGRQVSEAIRKADPGAKIVWEDADHLVWWRQFAELGVTDVIDVISPHTYNLHRSNPNPEHQPSLQQMRALQDFIREHKLPWKVWSGEVGFSSYQRDEGTTTPFYSSNSEPQQAQLLVRMMVLHLAAGIEKIFWYDFKNDGWEPNNPEHNFGLIRADFLPKPAIVAYANLIYRLRNAKWVRPYAIGGGGIAYAYVGMGKTAKPTLIAWTVEGEKTEPIPVESNVRKVTITDIYGRSMEVPVTNHLLSIEITPSPVYIDGLHKRDILPYITR